MKKTYIAPQNKVHQVRMNSAIMQASLNLMGKSALDTYGTEGDNSDVKEDFETVNIWNLY